MPSNKAERKTKVHRPGEGASLRREGKNRRNEIWLIRGTSYYLAALIRFDSFRFVPIEYSALVPLNNSAENLHSIYNHICRRCVVRGADEARHFGVGHKDVEYTNIGSPPRRTQRAAQDECTDTSSGRASGSPFRVVNSKFTNI